MRKPDDDLKIDIMELFGGDLPSPSDTLEDTPSPGEAAPTALPAETTTSETENQAREPEGGVNTEEVVQEPAAQETQSQASDETFSASELQSTQPEVEATPPEVPKSSIDFNAPIKPPFMGGLSPASGPNPYDPEPATEPEAAAPPADEEEIRRIQAEHEFLMFYDEFRNIIAQELKDLVGEKKTYTMLGRTVELAREKYPMIFRNANWDSAGNLLEDGSVDSQRILENKNSLDPQKGDETLDAALSALLKIRLQAVEKGLGTGLRNKVRAHMYQWISQKLQKAGAEGKDPAPLKRLSSYVTST